MDHTLRDPADREKTARDLKDSKKAPLVSQSWEEDRILRNWNLDPDDFPDPEEAYVPEIPEELEPFFEEATEDAVLQYAGYVPKTADLSAYSPRADAIRAAVRRTARRMAQNEGSRLLSSLEEAASSIGGRTFQETLAALQGRDLQKGDPAGSLAAFGQKEGAAGTTSQLSLAGPGGTPAPADPVYGLPSLQTYLQERKERQEKSASDREDAGRDTGVPDADGFAAQSSSGPENGSGEKDDDAEEVLAENAEQTGEDDQTAAQTDPARQLPGFSGNAYDSARFPVPPLLSDFTIRFPADPSAMKTPGGWTLFPGLTPYAGITDLPDPDARSADGEKTETASTQDTEDRSRVPFAASETENAGSLSFSAKDTEEAGAGRDPEEDAGRDGGTYGLYGPAFSGSPAAGSPLLQTARTPAAEKRTTVLIGDSRTVGMQIYVGGEENEYWSARNSMGYNWMVSTGVPAVEDRIGPDTDVVILMGVNDLGNMGRYVDYMNEKAAEWKARGARTFFVSVTPVRENGGHNATNARIEQFNNYALANLRGVHYIDAYSRIRDSFSSPDGLHYDGPTYREIYQIIHFYLYRGWYERAGLWFLFDCGRPLTGWQFVDGQWQYMDGLGVRWVKDGRVGDVVLAPYPETGILDPYKAVTAGR